MSYIADNLFTFATEKAKTARDVEKISSEVLEDCADESTYAASNMLYTESDDDDDFDDEFLDSLERELPDSEDDEEEAEEINRILSSDDDIDIDDIVGISDAID